jgi:hypothetical protein
MGDTTNSSGGPSTAGTTTVLPTSPTAKALSTTLDTIDDLRRSPALLEYFPGLGRQAIAAALRPPAPAGDPARVEDLATLYRNAETTSRVASVDLSAVARSKLPAAWRGAAGETAAQAIGALGSQMSGAVTAYGTGADALNTFAATLTLAKKNDSTGRTTLQSAQVATLFFSPSQAEWVRILADAADGCHARLNATLLRDGAAGDLATVLNQLASDAHAHDITAPGIDPLTAVVLTDTGDFGPSSDPLDQILTQAQTERASQLLAAMSPADRAAFEQLLANAGSPQESAYLWKALSNGYTLDQLRQFDQVVHPHGADPAWLSEHLSPHLNTDDTTVGDQYIPGYKGQLRANGVDFFSQGDVGDCVAASTVMARAQNDPVYMLGLTTGQGPQGGSNPGDDRPGTVAARVQNAFRSTDATYGQADNKSIHGLLNSATGSDYHNISTRTAAERQAALPQIEAAVNSGKPVLIGVTGENAGHQMTILAARGDELEIYNPWGTTQWVTKEQYVNGQLGLLTSDSPTGGLATSDRVTIP